MVERNGIQQSGQEQAVQVVPTIENLVQRLGVPIDRVEVYAAALFVAFGKEDRPDSRVREYLEFKLRQKEQSV